MATRQENKGACSCCGDTCHCCDNVDFGIPGTEGYHSEIDITFSMSSSYYPGETIRVYKTSYVQETPGFPPFCKWASADNKIRVMVWTMPFHDVTIYDDGSDADGDYVYINSYNNFESTIPLNGLICRIKDYDPDDMYPGYDPDGSWIPEGSEFDLVAPVAASWVVCGVILG